MSGRSSLAHLLALAALSASLIAPASVVAAGPPLIESTSVTEVNATAANLRALINPNGLSTSYRFEYIPEAAYQANLAASPPREGFSGASLAPPSGATKIGSGATAIPAVQHLGALSPATAYRYRVSVSNSAGTLTGPERALATQEPSLVLLPDGRAWELVSPLDKGGGAIQGPGQNFGGDLDQAALQGGAFTYSSAAAFGEAPGAPPASQYLATRGAAGWSSVNISSPLHSGAYGEEPDGVPYRLFSPDFSRGLLFGGECQREEGECAGSNPPLPGSGAPPGYANYYLRDGATGGFGGLLSATAVAESSLGPRDLRVSFAGASPDLSHVILSSCAALTPGASEVPSGPGECDAKEPNLYEWSSTGLSLVNLLPGAALAASLGAVSSDGDRVYWTDLDSGNLYLREGAQSTQVDEATGEEGTFQAASSDGAIAFFTTEAGHLYRFVTETNTASDLTPAGGVKGVLGASADGSYVYYQGPTGIEQWHEGATIEVAAGASAALPSDYPPASGTARVSPDGAHLAFLSASLGIESAGPGVTQAYLYGPLPGGSAATLVCASCNPTGEQPVGAASIPGAPPNGARPAPYKPRVLSVDGSRLFFESDEALASQDTNARTDVYQWEARGRGSCQRSPGCVNLISSGRSPGGATFLDASADGADAFFLTDASLVAADPGSIDVYDARVGGGLAEAPKPIPCVGDACQSLPEAPDDPTPGTLVPNSGNPALSIVKEKHKRKKHKKHGSKKQKGHKHQKGERGAGRR